MEVVPKLLEPAVQAIHMTGMDERNIAKWFLFENYYFYLFYLFYFSIKIMFENL